MKAWEAALERFCHIARQHGIDFYLIGSVTAAIRGVDITPTTLTRWWM